MPFEIETEDSDQAFEFRFTLRNCLILIPIVILALVGAGMLAGLALDKVLHLLHLA